MPRVRFCGVKCVDSIGLFTTILGRFGALGGVELDLPGREEPARADVGQRDASWGGQDRDGPGLLARAFRR
jgi:hypothetical protein